MKKRTTSFILLTTILLQSCVAYQNTSVAINEAQNKGQVKVITTLGDAIKFKNINMKNEVYYGVNGNKVTLLDARQILSIHLKDLKKSKTQTIVLTTLISISVLTLAIVAVVAATAVAYSIVPYILLGGI